MRILFQNYARGELSLVEVPLSSTRPGYLLVQTRSSLVSVGSEKTIIQLAQKSLLGKALARPDWVRQVVDKARTDGLVEAYRQSTARLDIPLPLGYSSAGLIADVGSGVTEFAVGDRVACAGSGYASHAEVISVPRNLCVKIPGGVSFEQASFVALGGIALEAVRIAHAELGHRVVVIGLGLLGQLTVQILKAAGCHVLGVDIATDKVKLAHELGADVAVNSATQDVITAVQGFTHGHGADSVIIMASTQSNQPIEQAAEICRERGRVVATGLVGLEIPRKPFYEKEIEFVVSRAWGPGMYDVDYEERDVKYPLPYVRWTARRNMAAFLDLVAEGRVRIEPLITHRFPFERALEAYEMILENKEPYIGVLLTYLERPNTDQKIRLRVQSHRLSDVSPKLSLIGQRPIGVGLIGAGLYARGTLLPALQKVKGLRYVGVATVSGMSGRHIGDRFGFEYCTTDYRELLSDPEIDAIFILTRHGSHARFVSESLRAGKTVFVEKPLALNEEGLREVARAWQEGAGFLMVGFNRRFAPTAVRARDLLSRGTGPFVAHVRCNAGHVPADSWVHDPKQGGGRIVGEVCHFVDLLQYLTGELPTEVFVAAARESGPPTHDNIAITLKMDSGSVGSIVYAAGGDKAFPRECVEVFGHGAVCVIDNFKSMTFTQGGKTQKKRSWFSVERGHVDELRTFFQHLRQGESQPVPLREYIATTLATFAMVESIRQSKPIAVDVNSFLAGTEDTTAEERKVRRVKGEA